MVSLTSLHENVSYLGVASLVAPLVAQTVKNPPAMQKTQVPSLGWEDSLEKELATHSIMLCLENFRDRGALLAIVNGVPKSWT